MYLIMVCCSCGKDLDKTNIFYLYYYLGSNICSFEGTATYYLEKTGKSVEYEINYNPVIAGHITKKVNDKFIAEYIIKEQKILYKPANGKNTYVDDTEVNRLQLDIPVNLGIDPYYFLETDLNKSTISTSDNDRITVIYNSDNYSLTAIINFKDNRIVKIQVLNNSIPVMEINYSDFLEVENRIFFPMKYELIQIPPGREQIKTTVSYKISKIKLCK